MPKKKLMNEYTYKFILYFMQLNSKIREGAINEKLEWLIQNFFYFPTPSLAVQLFIQSFLSIYVPFPILNLVMTRTFSNSKGLITSLNLWSNLHRLSQGVVSSFSPTGVIMENTEIIYSTLQPSVQPSIIVMVRCIAATHLSLLLPLHLSSLRARADAEQSTLYNLGFI